MILQIVCDSSAGTYFCNDKTQPWESAAAFGNAVINAVQCWFYDGKKMPS